MKPEIDFPSIVEKFDDILKRGLCRGVGKPDGLMCIEAAITQAMGLPFNDEPACVSPAVRRYKIRLNDSQQWQSPESRAKGLRDLGIAQIGSAGVVDDVAFSHRLAEKTVRVLIPALFRDVFKDKAECLAAADRCEREGTKEAARYAAASAANSAANSAAYDSAANAAAAASAANSANSAAFAAYAANSASEEKYLLLSASLALEVLRELKSPGCEWIGGTSHDLKTAKPLWSWRSSGRW